MFPRFLPAFCNISRLLPAACLVGGLILAGSALADPLADAEATWNAGEMRNAAIQLQDLLQHDPANAEARLLLGRIVLDSGNPVAAEGILRKAQAAGATSALVPIGEALLLQGKTAALLEEIQSTESDDPAMRSEVARLRGEALLAQLDKEAAVVQIDLALKLDPNNIKAIVTKALIMLGNDDPAAARQMLETAAERDPESRRVWQALGMLALREGDNAAAERAFGMAILAPKSGWAAHIKRALARLDAGEVQGAELDIDAAADENPGYIGLYYLRGRTLLIKGDSEAAAEQIEKYLQAVPGDLEASYYGGLALLRSGKPAQARELLTPVAQAAPNMWQAAVLLARAESLLGENAAAEARLSRFAQDPRVPPQAKKLLLQILATQGKRQDVTDLLEQLATSGGMKGLPEMRIAYAESLIRSGRQTEAIDLLRNESVPSGDALKARLMLIRGLASDEQLDEALSEAEQLLREHPDEPAAINALGAVQALAGDAELARTTLSAALVGELANQPGAIAAAMTLARLELAAKQPQKARDALERALAQHGGNVPLTLALAQLDRLEGRSEDAITRLTKALEKDPESLQLRVKLIQLLWSTNQREVATRLLAEVPKQQAESPVILRLKGIDSLASGRAADALTHFEHLIDLRPQAPMARLLAAQALSQLGRPRESREKLSEAVELKAHPKAVAAAIAEILKRQPDKSARRTFLEEIAAAASFKSEVLYAIAEGAIASGQRDLASHWQERLITTNPDDRKAHLQYLINAQVLRHFDRAREVGEDWIARHPDDVEAITAVAQIQVMSGDQGAARASYDKLLAISPDNALAANNLAWLLREKDPQRARSLAEKANELLPNNPDYLDTLASIVSDQGDADQALTLLAQAHKARPEDPNIALNYAEHLVKAGKQSEARDTLIKIVDHDFPERERALELLETLGN